jgi:DNA mismatch repair protein MutS2
VLEFAAVLERVADRTQSAGGARCVRALVPSADAAWVRERHALLAEARLLLAPGEPPWPLQPIHDLHAALHEAARPGACLEAVELLQVGATLVTAARLQRVLQAQAQRAPRLGARGGALQPHAELSDAIGNAILETGEVSDAASPPLRDIRRRQVQVREAVLARLDALLAESRPEHDAYVTVRGDRYVIPVRTDASRSVQGIVHDRSASGATLFVEPLGIVDANNELQELRDAESREIARILRDLTARVGAAAPHIDASLATLEELDALHALVVFGQEAGGASPRIDARLQLRQARHPLVEAQLAASGTRIVPLDLDVGAARGLVITGPNTGGKTVALKSLGLLALMHQAGMPVPAHADTTLPVFAQVIADIGDEQSIATAHSTFSSHMRHVVHAVREAGPGVLVLLDEFMSGTDPEEGAALARVILRRLVQRGALVVVTSHLGALKVFAHSEPGLVNVAMQFDASSRAPTFRLQHGVPGSSNAFDVAARLGLDADLLAQARQERGAGADLADVIQALETERATLEVARRSAEAESVEARRLREEHATALARIERTRREALDAARREAAGLVSRAQAEIERVVREIRESGAERDRIRAAQDAMQALRQETRGPEPAAPAPGADVLEREPVANDRVFVGQLGREAIFVRREGDERARVRVGNVEFVVALSDVAVAAGPPAAAGSARTAAPATGPAPAAGGHSRPEADAVSLRLDLRGLEREEAVNALEAFIDRLLLQGAPQAQIIHGKGAGVLRRAVQELLARHPQVSAYRLGDHGEGGSGVTIVTLR